MVVVRRARPDELARCLAVRREVFVDEQHVRHDEEMDGRDPVCVHFVALADDDVVGTARLRVTDDGHAKAERVAVRRAFRRTGAGRALMRALEAHARNDGHTEIVLNAQTIVIEFYTQLGYRAEGDEFRQAGIPHRTMRKRLA